MLRSHANTLLSVRQATQLNAGSKTAGIDGKIALTSSLVAVHQQDRPVQQTQLIDHVHIVHITVVTGRDTQRLQHRIRVGLDVAAIHVQYTQPGVGSHVRVELEQAGLADTARSVHEQHGKRRHVAGQGVTEQTDLASPADESPPSSGRQGAQPACLRIGPAT